MAYAFINPWALTEGYHQEQDRLDNNDLQQAAEQRRQAAEARTQSADARAQQNFNIDMQYKPQKLQSALDSSNAQLNYYNQLALNNKNINATYEAGAPNRAAAQTIFDDSNQNALAKINADKIMRDNGFTATDSTNPDFQQRFDSVIASLPPGSREATHLNNTRQSWAFGQAKIALADPNSDPQQIIALATKAGIQLAPFSTARNPQEWRQTAAQQLGAAADRLTARQSLSEDAAAAEIGRQKTLPKVQPETPEVYDGKPDAETLKSAHTVLNKPSNHSPEVIAAARDVVMRSLRMLPPPTTPAPITPESAINRNEPMGLEGPRGLDRTTNTDYYRPQIVSPTAAQTATPPTVYNDTRRSQSPAQSQSAIPAMVSPPQQMPQDEISQRMAAADARIESVAQRIIPKGRGGSNARRDALIEQLKKQDPEYQALSRQFYSLDNNPAAYAQ